MGVANRSPANTRMIWHGLRPMLDAMLLILRQKPGFDADQCRVHVRMRAIDLQNLLTLAV